MENFYTLEHLISDDLIHKVNLESLEIRKDLDKFELANKIDQIITKEYINLGFPKSEKEKKFNNSIKEKIRKEILK